MAFSWLLTAVHLPEQLENYFGNWKIISSTGNWTTGILIPLHLSHHPVNKTFIILGKNDHHFTHFLQNHTKFATCTSKHFFTTSTGLNVVIGTMNVVTHALPNLSREKKQTSPLFLLFFPESWILGDFYVHDRKLDVRKLDEFYLACWKVARVFTWKLLEFF